MFVGASAGFGIKSQLFVFESVMYISAHETKIYQGVCRAQAHVNYECIRVSHLARCFRNEQNTIYSEYIFPLLHIRWRLRVKRFAHIYTYGLRVLYIYLSAGVYHHR